ncbi:hypothetical protein N7507_010170 [Penicillium longicatenatum]|nr:hypothetical protein N7507_010170 [Penicillium longicatenatum]
MSTLAPSQLQFRILPATENDCHELAKIEAAALASVNKEPQSSLWGITFGPPTEEGIAFRTKNFTDTLQNGPSKFWKAVIPDETSPTGERIVACALWCFYQQPEKTSDWKDTTDWPSTANVEACNELIGELNNLKKRHMDEKCYGLLRVLCTLPEYRGCGIASALIRVGLDYGVKEGLKLFWLHGSADGQGLYRKFGFVDVEALEKDITKYGGIGKTNVMGMRLVIE